MRMALSLFRVARCRAIYHDATSVWGFSIGSTASNWEKLVDLLAKTERVTNRIWVRYKMTSNYSKFFACNSFDKATVIFKRPNIEPNNDRR